MIKSHYGNFWIQPKNHVMENHTMENHVIQGITVYYINNLETHPPLKQPEIQSYTIYLVITGSKLNYL